MELVIFYLLLALSVSFLCSVLEAVLLSTPVSFITMKEQEGAKNAPLMKRLKQDIDKPISAILSLNTIAHTVGSAGVGAEAVKVFGEVYFGVISAVLTILILVLSEIIPKTIGSYYWRQLAMPAATVIRVMIIISYPLVWLSEWITKLVASKKQPLSVSREEVSAMVSVGTQEGIFDNSESQMIQSLFKLSSKILYEIMTPRTVAITASANMKLKDFYANQMHRIYSRIPVYDDNPNFITGFVLKQTVLEELAEDKFDKQLKDIRRPILSYNEDRLVSEVWEEMLLKKEHIAQVQDEYGCFLGIITMEDIIETVIGREIVDESDTIVDMQAYAREKWQKELKHKNKL
jgi:CBS domain containing-hemolysin-like protein